jgi:uncharacterized membrane protein
MPSVHVYSDSARGVPASPSGPAHVFELRPNRSLDADGARRFIAAVALGTFGVAAFFAIRGFWPILVFATLEVALVAWALRASIRSGDVLETITITPNTVAIEHHERGHERSAVFPRHWSRVTLHAPLAALHPSRLVFESCGRVCEVGRFLTEDERRSLALRLKQLVGNMNDSPAL